LARSPVHPGRPVGPTQHTRSAPPSTPGRPHPARPVRPTQRARSAPPSTPGRPHPAHPVGPTQRTRDRAISPLSENRPHFQRAASDPGLAQSGRAGVRARKGRLEWFGRREAPMSAASPEPMLGWGSLPSPHPAIMMAGGHSVGNRTSVHTGWPARWTIHLGCGLRAGLGGRIQGGARVPDSRAARVPDSGPGSGAGSKAGLGCRTPRRARCRIQGGARVRGPRRGSGAGLQGGLGAGSKASSTNRCQGWA
jgi:hypothetical protein